MITTGAVPFNSFKDKLSKIINRLRDEFNRKVQIRIDNNLILYTHIDNLKDE